MVVSSERNSISFNIDCNNSIFSSSILLTFLQDLTKSNSKSLDAEKNSTEPEVKKNKDVTDQIILKN
jgi:hypothetical protein